MHILFWLFTALTFSKSGSCWRTSFMAASVIFGVALLLITEFLSLFGAFHAAGLWTSWTVVTICSGLLWYKVARVEREGERVELTPFLKVLIALVIAIILITALIAIIAPPNNWDSMSYHMARVVHWMQNRSVAHYPTNILRQVAMPPWAEFFVAQMQIMSGGDRLSNLAQWFSMVGSVLGVTLIAARLGATARAQVFSAVIAATIPMGIVQASSTQNDYVAALWLVCFVYYGLKWKEKPTIIYAFFTGAGLALAVLTKGTAYIFALPFLLWFLFSVLKSIGSRAPLHFVLIFFVVIIINAGHYLRNVELFGSPISTANLQFSNELFGPSTLISNISRNMAMHLSTPFEGVNSVTESIVEGLHAPLATGVSDPRTTWDNKLFSVKKLSTHEDRSQNPLHLILIVVMLVLFLFFRRFRGPPELRYYLGALVLSFLLFSFYLKWQPWHSRLQLPLFVLLSPFPAILLTKAASKKAAGAVVAVLLLASLPWLFFNELRPVIAEANIINTSRIDQYFKYRPRLKEPYIYTVKSIISSGCTDVGLKIGSDDWEYPFWVLFKRLGEQRVRIEHIRIENVSLIKAKEEPFASFKPCYLISW